jgi:hypothetical protein
MEDEALQQLRAFNLVWRMVLVRDYEYLPLVAPEDLSRCQHTGFTPLYLACSQLDCDGVAALLDAGADPDAPASESGRFTLFDAIEGGVREFRAGGRYKEGRARAAEILSMLPASRAAAA